MTGLWLVSYLVLWAVVLVMGLCLIGILRQLGLIFRQLEPSLPPPQPQGESPIPELENDGPPIGSPLGDLQVDTLNGFGTLTAATLRDRGPLLLMFLSPLCETCQHIVEPLNALAADATHAVGPMVIMRADESGCRAFLSVFPLHMPVVCDGNRTITKGFDVHHNPFGLLYDEGGILIKKGILEGHEHLLALLGDESAPVTAQADVFPPVVPSKV